MNTQYISYVFVAQSRMQTRMHAFAWIELWPNQISISNKQSNLRVNASAHFCFSPVLTPYKLDWLETHMCEFRPKKPL